MIKYDDSSLSVEKRGKLPLFDGLEEFATKLSMIKPMINFVVKHSCVANKYVKKSDDSGLGEDKVFITNFVVFENGEELGAIGTDIRYRGAEKDLVYEVESFRINKTRGSQNEKASKDIRVALRLAKKTLVAREDDEAKSLIQRHIADGILNSYNLASNHLRWSMETIDEAFLYAMLAYNARLNGETIVKLPSKLRSVKDDGEHDKRCATLEDCTTIKNMFSAGKGYGVHKLADGRLNVFSFGNDSLKRYNSFDSLPDAIQSKYAVFKVLKNMEIVTTIGVKINDEFAYVVE
jgi:hypothetical protein